MVRCKVRLVSRWVCSVGTVGPWERQVGDRWLLNVIKNIRFLQTSTSMLGEGR